MIWLFPAVIGMIDVSSWYLLKKMQWGNYIFWGAYYMVNLLLAIAFAIVE